jgi:hypothetical protein
MSHPLVTVLLMLALLLQGLAPARAMTVASVDPPATAEPQAAMPCHGTQAAEPAAAPERAATSCCDAGIDCSHCSAGCMATPAPDSRASSLLRAPNDLHLQHPRPTGCGRRSPASTDDGGCWRDA